jgi:hypothetical protein
MKTLFIYSKTRILILVAQLFIYSKYTTAQEVNIHAEIFVHEFNRKNEVVEGATVLLIVQDDTLARLETNQNGYCIWDGKAHKKDSIQFQVSKRFFNSQHFYSPVVESDMDLKLEFDLIPFHVLRPLNPLFSDDTTLIFSNFEVELFKFKFRKIPEYCLEFVYVSNDEVNDKLASKRMEIFKNYLLTNGISEKMFHFLEKSIITEKPLEDDCKAIIQGRLVSMSPCSE